MRCPKCGCEDSKVIDSRSSEAGTAIRRRRECLNPACAERFTTYERREETPIQVRKKDGTLEPFDRAKLMASLVKASIKRSIPVEELNGLMVNVQPGTLMAKAGKPLDQNQRDVLRATKVREVCAKIKTC